MGYIVGALKECIEEGAEAMAADVKEPSCCCEAHETEPAVQASEASAAPGAEDACCVSSSAAGTASGKKTCGCRYKETERSREFQADLQKRLNRAMGQLNGVKNMIDENRYCGDVLTQLAAAESAIHTVSEILLRDHLETCVTDRIRRGDDEAVDEAMQLIKRFAR